MLQKVTEGKRWLHHTFIDIKLKAIMYFLNCCFYLRSLLCARETRFATCLPEKNCSARTNTSYFDARKYSFIWVGYCKVKRWGLMFHMIYLGFFCTSVKGEKGWRTLHVSCPGPKLQVYPVQDLAYRWSRSIITILIIIMKDLLYANL